MVNSVTVLIPTRNRAKVLIPLLKNLHNCKCVKSIFILNNSSIKIKLSPSIKSKVKIYNLPDLNLLQAKNYVSNFLDTRWALILDDDVQIKSAVVEKFLKYSKAHFFDIASGILLENSRYSKFDPIKLTKYGNYSFYAVPSLNTDNISKQNPAPAEVVPGGFMLVRSVLLKKMQFDTNYLAPFYNEDSDFQYRALKSGYTIVVFNDIYAKHLKSKSGGLRSYSKINNIWWYSLGFNNVYFRVKNFSLYKLCLYFIFRPQDIIFVLRQKNVRFLFNFLLGQVDGYKKAKKNIS